MRVQVPPEEVPCVLTAITSVAPAGTRGLHQGPARALAVQTAGGLKRRHDGLPSKEVSLTVPDDEEVLAAVIEATQRRTAHAC